MFLSLTNRVANGSSLKKFQDCAVCHVSRTDPESFLDAVSPDLQALTNLWITTHLTFSITCLPYAPLAIHPSYH